jgi:RES domain-containing protein
MADDGIIPALRLSTHPQPSRSRSSKSLSVHLDASEAPGDLVAIPADIPGSLVVSHVRSSQLPADWRDYPAPDELAEIGTRWVRRARTAVLAVPSAVIPLELNYLLNPAHPEFEKIRIGRRLQFRFDSRMWKRRPPSG